MKPLNILGLILFFTGSFTLIGFGFYQFFKDLEIPMLIKLSIIAIILGIIIIIFSLIRERLNEK